jgi:hypothetical protein
VMPRLHILATLGRIRTKNGQGWKDQVFCGICWGGA